MKRLRLAFLTALILFAAANNLKAEKKNPLDYLPRDTVLYVEIKEPEFFARNFAGMSFWKNEKAGQIGYKMLLSSLSKDLGSFSRILPGLPKYFKTFHLGISGLGQGGYSYILIGTPNNAEDFEHVISSFKN